MTREIQYPSIVLNYSENTVGEIEQRSGGELQPIGVSASTKRFQKWRSTMDAHEYYNVIVRLEQEISELHTMLIDCRKWIYPKITGDETSKLFF